jgi:protein-tyrosine phosphatase
MNRYRILFICMGNICRSPSAEGIFRQLLIDHSLENKVEVDSAGTGGWHVGSAPDSRAQEAANQRGVNLSNLKARQVTSKDFDEFDLLIAMDIDNQNKLYEIARPEQENKVKLLLQYSKKFEQTEVPDPYYGGDNGFDLVLDMIEESTAELLKTLQVSNAV